MHKFYSIGDISKIFGVSVDTLRYYAKINLINPKYIGTNRYRYYCIDQFEFITTVLFLRSIDLPIEQIKSLLNAGDVSNFQKELQDQQATLKKQIEKLNQIKTALETFSHMSDDFNDTNVSLRKVPRLYMVSLPFGSQKFEVNTDDIASLRPLIEQTWLSTANIISTISPDNFWSGDYHNYDCYGMISETINTSRDPCVQVLEEGCYVCADAMVVKANHKDINPIYDSLKSYIKDQKLTIVGPLIERNLLDLIKGENNVHLIRIYVPVTSEANNKGDIIESN